MTWKCFIGKIYHVNILPTDISSNRSEYLLISDGIIVKSEITNVWVIYSSTYCSLLTKVIFKCVLTKPFCQNIFDMIEWTVIFRPSNIWQEINIILWAFLEKLPGRCSIDTNLLQNILGRHFAANQINHRWLK